MNRPASPLSPAPAADSVAGEEDPGAAVDAPAPPPALNDADKAAERSNRAAEDNGKGPFTSA